MAPAQKKNEEIEVSSLAAFLCAWSGQVDSTQKPLPYHGLSRTCLRRAEYLVTDFTRRLAAQVLRDAEKALLASCSRSLLLRT